MLIDIIQEITIGLCLPIESVSTVTEDEIVNCKLSFFVHSVSELVTALHRLYQIEGIDSVCADGIR